MKLFLGKVYRRGSQWFFQKIIFPAELILRRWIAILFRKPTLRNQRLAFNVYPARGSWGGGNQWLLQLARYSADCGSAVQFSVRGATIVFLVSPQESNPMMAFTVEAIQREKQRNKTLRCIHRINECDQRKGSEGVDAALAAANAVADYTVFVSQWLCEYHQARWFSGGRAHSVIINGANDRVFYPATPRQSPRTFRIVTHHWSDNWKKGFHEYRAIDQAIAEGKLPDVELWIIGRWPRDLSWQAARTFPPCQGAALAKLLQQCDLYVTASRFEPGAMHYVEGAQCGLPVMYHRDTGGAPEVVHSYGIVFDEDVVSVVEQARSQYRSLKAALMASAPSGTRMCKQYHQIISELKESESIHS